MPPPNDALAFSSEFHLVAPPHHELALSDKLADLLSVAREQYKWKAETTKESQEGSMELENETARRLTNLDEEDARWIAQEVSRWGGNNVRAIQTIASWSSEQSRKVADLINQLLTSASIRYAMCQLTKGIAHK